jgi:hypothetical protein
MNIKKVFIRKNLILIIGFFGLYLFATGLSFAFFSIAIKPEQTVSPQKQEELKKQGFLVDTTGPKTEICPINGDKYTKAEKDAWEVRRPLLVMIENHENARPQSGISRADIMYEAVAEGGITRFMAVFFCDAQARESILGPIRSARTYFLDWASEYGKFPLYAHVGGANTPGPANALGQIEDYGWGGATGNDLNQFAIGYPAFWRDYERMGRTVLTEHTMYSTTERLWGVGKARGWTDKSADGEEWQNYFDPWKFDYSNGSKGEVGKISFGFWDNSPKYDVLWIYDPENNLYKRNNGGQPHKDLDYDQQVTAKNVIVQFLKESNANDGYENNLHLLYGTIGEGKALVFSNGKAIEAKWVKKTRLARTKFYDNSGEEIKFIPGKIWIEILPVGNKVTY